MLWPYHMEHVGASPSDVPKSSLIMLDIHELNRKRPCPCGKKIWKYF